MNKSDWSAAIILWLFAIAAGVTISEDTPTIIIIGLVSAVIIIGVAIHMTMYGAPKKRKPKRRDTEQLMMVLTIKPVSATSENDDSDEDDEADSVEYYTRIAGAKYRNTAKDIGGFIGYVRSEPHNEHDPNAIAIYRNDGKHMGYIPKAEQETYREWSCKDNLPCVGYIVEGYDVEIFGKVKVIDADKTTTIIEMVEYIAWMVNKHGKAFVPKGVRVDSPTQPHTQEEWLEVLYNFINKSRRG